MVKTLYENIENDLKNIEFYQSHPTLIPFVGHRYLNNELGMKILLVGESHYVEKPYVVLKDSSHVDLTKENLITDWWSDNPPEIYDTNYYYTRGTVESFMSGKPIKSHRMFRNPCKVYNEKFLGSAHKGKIAIREIYNSFAYMNYFQMPALYGGISFGDSLLKFKKETNIDCPNTEEVLNKTKAESNKVFHAAVEVLKPDIIIFLSVEAYLTFCEQNLNHKDGVFKEIGVFYTPHPTSHYQWYGKKEMKYDDDLHVKGELLTGEEKLERIFEKYAKIKQ